MAFGSLKDKTVKPRLGLYRRPWKMPSSRAGFGETGVALRTGQQAQALGNCRADAGTRGGKAPAGQGGNSAQASWL